MRNFYLSLSIARLEISCFLKFLGVLTMFCHFSRTSVLCMYDFQTFGQIVESQKDVFKNQKDQNSWNLLQKLQNSIIFSLKPGGLFAL